MTYLTVIDSTQRYRDSLSAVLYLVGISKLPEPLRFIENKPRKHDQV